MQVALSECSLINCLLIVGLFLFLFFLQSSITNTYSKSKIINIFRISRQGEDERFAPYNNYHRRLLWHGSGIVNFAGIITQGLRIAPPEADASG